MGKVGGLLKTINIGHFVVLSLLMKVPPNSVGATARIELLHLLEAQRPAKP